MGRVGLGPNFSTCSGLGRQLMGWVGSGRIKWTHGQLWSGCPICRPLHVAAACLLLWARWAADIIDRSRRQHRNNRQWVAVASAGPYASLHIATLGNRVRATSTLLPILVKIKKCIIPVGRCRAPVARGGRRAAWCSRTGPRSVSVVPTPSGSSRTARSGRWDGPRRLRSTTAEGPPLPPAPADPTPAPVSGRTHRVTWRHRVYGQGTVARHGTGSLGHRVNGSFGSPFTSGTPGHHFDPVWDLSFSGFRKKTQDKDIKMCIFVKIRPTVIEILTFKWSSKFYF